MKKSCLYIAFFTSVNHYDCLGLSYQINGDLLCIFNDETYYYLYSSLLEEHRNKIKVITDDPSIHTLLDNLVQQYSNIVLLHNTKLIIQSLDIERIIQKNIATNTINNLVDENDKVAITIVPISKINELLRNNITLYSLIISPKSALKNNTSNIRLLNYYQHSVIEEKHHQKSPKIFYEDNNCIFAIFEQKQSAPLLRSPCYINKHNQRIYSTTNACAGQIILSKDDKYQIKWSYNNNTYDCEYTFDKETEQFI